MREAEEDKWRGQLATGAVKQDNESSAVVQELVAMTRLKGTTRTKHTMDMKNPHTQPCMVPGAQTDHGPGSRTLVDTAGSCVACPVQSGCCMCLVHT